MSAIKFSGEFGTAPSEVLIELKPAGKDTRVTITHTWNVTVDPETAASYEWGWTELIGTRLKEFVETGERLGVSKANPKPARKRK